MMEQIKEHMDTLFDEAPKTRKNFELKEEMTANAIERYHDLLSQGMGAEDAYKNVISNIGDVSELFHASSDDNRGEPVYLDERKKKSAIITASSIALYFIAALALFSSGTILDDDTGFLIAIAICIVPTCMLVYNHMTYPSYLKKEDTVVEDFKEWNHSKKKRQGLMGAISAILWTFTVLAYFLISFATYSWEVTWLVFLAAACLQTVITLIFKVKEME